MVKLKRGIKANFSGEKRGSSTFRHAVEGINKRYNHEGWKFYFTVSC